MVKVERLTPAIGATIEDFPLSGRPSADEGDLLHRLLMEHQVLFFPELDLSPRTLADLGTALGVLGARHHLYQTHPDHDDVVVLRWGDGRRPDAAEWHADMTYRAETPFCSILQAIEVPPAGGDTLWASMYAVLDAIDPGLRRDLAELSAVHDMGAFRTPAYRHGGNEGIATAHQHAGSAVHPVVAIHPVTGRPYLNVSESFTRFVVDLSGPESSRLLTYLFDLTNRPDFHVRLRWKPGTVAVWDNRGTQHYAVADYGDHRRVMHRVAVATDHRSPDPGSTTTDRSCQ